jgi:mono/diheme cytochrome c family protein
MGFGGDALLHLSYGRPGLFRIYADSSAGGATGAALSLLRDFPDPLLKGEYNPRDGFLYLAGFKVWDSNAKTVTAFDRLRYTGQPPLQPLSVQAGTQGVLLRFATPLDRATATAPGRYQIQRYNYKRTQDYGSGYFKLDGSIGQDTLRVAAAHLSADGTALLLVVPDVREVMQMSLAYDLRTTGGRAITDTLYLTLPRVAEMSLAPAGFGEVDWRKELSQAAPAPPAGAAAQPTAQLGAQVYQRAGCVACHSADGTTEGRMGPTFRGLFGSTRTFAAGTSRRADEAYIRQSILQPASQIVRGYPEGMPSFLGVLSDREIESLVLYLRSLGG